MIVKVLNTYFVLNSSGKSMEGFPSSFSLSSVLTFASCSVLDGRETYGRVDLHSKMKWPASRSSQPRERKVRVICRSTCSQAFLTNGGG